MIEAKNKKKRIFRLSLMIFVLFTGFVLSLCLKPNEKVKATYSSLCSSAGSGTGYTVDASGNLTVTGTATFTDAQYDITTKEIYCRSITINSGGILNLFPKTTATKASTDNRRLVLDTDLTIIGTGTLNLNGGNTSDAGTLGFGMYIQVGGNVINNGTISADGKGYLAGKGAGGGVTNAAYAGAPIGSITFYGSASDPVDLGSGGTGAGGGVVYITAGNITNNGTITANGVTNASGGSIRLSANIINGSVSTAVIQANSAGNSGGGRIALLYNTLSFPGNITAYSAGTGGAGTIYKKKNTDTYPELAIANNYQTYGASYSVYDNNIGKTRIDSGTYKKITTWKRSNAFIDATNIVNINGGTFEVNNSKFENKGTINSSGASDTLLIKNTAQVFNSGSGAFNSTAAFINMNSNSIVVLDGKDTYFENQNNKEQNLANLSITNGAVLSHKINDDITCQGLTGASKCNLITDSNGDHYDQHYTLRLNTTNILIDKKSQINVKGKGYFNSTNVGTGYGPGGGGIYYYDGRPGGYGGEGGDGNPNDDYGRSYGLATDPNDLGSSGGPGYAALGAGGGLIRIRNEGDLVNNGSINADGYDPNNSGGPGSGGGIKIESNKIIGSGSITASAMIEGVVPYTSTNGAGGGRILLVYKDLKDFYGLVSSKGREADNSTSCSSTSVYSCSGGAGTIVFAQTPHIGSEILNNKELIISNHNSSANPYSIIGITKLQGADLTNYKNITIKGKTNLIIDGGSSLVVDNGNFEINNSQVTNNGQLSDSGTLSTLILKNGTEFYNATTSIPGINFTNTNSKVIFDGSGTYFENQNNVEQKMGNLYIQNGVLLSHKENTGITCTPDPGNLCTLTTDANGTHYNQDYTLRISAVNTYIDSYSTIDVTGKGYAASSTLYSGGYGPGGGKYYSGGYDYGHPAGYGGLSGDLNPLDSYGATYGSANDPNDLGSGGSIGYGGVGYSGGGLVRINTSGDIIVNGSIIANGSSGSVLVGGSGSGGGIKLSGANIIVNGSLSATTPGTFTYGGGGGGGRIAVLASTGKTSIVNNNLNVLGRVGGNPYNAGETAGQNGTIYVSNGDGDGTAGPSALPTGITPTNFDYSPLPSNNTSYINSSETASVINTDIIDEGQPPLYSPDEYTSLLLHMEGANNGNIFTDSSFNNLSVTTSGNTKTVTPTVAPFAKFGTSMGNFPATTQPSGWGNGGDYLISTNSNAYNFGTGAFTVDTWIYPKVIDSTDGNSIWTISDGAGTHNTKVYLNILPTGAIQYYESGVGGRTTAAGVITTNHWYHVAMIRDGSGNLKLFVNGVQKTFISGSPTSTYNFNWDTFVVGWYDGLGNVLYFNGYMDEFRVSKGIARWTSDFDINNLGNFIPSSYTPLNLKALKSVTGSVPSIVASLLMHMDSDSPFIDDSGNNHIISGNALSITPTPQKFGKAAFFNGSYSLSIPDSPDFSLSPGPFTIDFWIKSTQTSGSYPAILRSATNSSWAGGYAIGLPSTNWYFYYPYPAGNQVLIASGAAVGDGNWHHIAITRDNANNIRTFFDGSLSATGVQVGDDSSTAPLQIGVGDTFINNTFIDELRILKGTATWTSNFTPPTSPYTSGNSGTPGGVFTDTDFNNQARITLTDNLAGQYIFVGCAGANCVVGPGGSYVDVIFNSGIANVGLKIKDVRTGAVKHHSYSSFKITTSAAGYLGNNYPVGAVEFLDATPERKIPPSNITIATKVFTKGVGFKIINNNQGTTQNEQDLGGNIVVRGPVTSTTYSLILNRNTIYKRGDYLNANGSISGTATSYQVVCVNTASYGETIYCNDDLGNVITGGTYNYGFYTFNKTYNFFTQNEASNYSPVVLKQVTIPSSEINPPNVSNFSVNSTGGKLTISWNNPADNLGQTKTLVVRKKAPGISWFPVDGTDYNIGTYTGNANEEIIYDSTNVGLGGAAQSFDDTDVVSGNQYCYNIYTQFIGLNYPAYNSVTEICTIPTPPLDPPTNLVVSANGMRVTANWTASSPGVGLVKYILVRMAGATPTFTPTNGVDYTLPANKDLGGGNVLVYSGTGNVNIPDDEVDNIQYYYKVYAQYNFSGIVYSAGAVSTSVTPSANNLNTFHVISSSSPGPYNVIIDDMTAPNPNYSVNKYLIVREITPACNIDFIPVTNTDYSVGPSGVPNEDIIYASASLPTIPYTDSIGVSAGTKVCYKAFVQYDGETTGTPNPHLIYSSGSATDITPPNNPPQIQIISINQSLGSENVVIQYQVKDIDVENVTVQFTMDNPCSGTVINTVPITISATASWSSTQTYNWNPAGTLCPNQETTSASLAAKVSDVLLDNNTVYSTFSLDTLAPVLPATLSDFNLVFSSKTADSITVATGINGATDGNLKTTAAYKVFYKQGLVVDDSSIQIPPSLDIYSSGTTFTATSLSPNQQYTFNIWAYDKYGHKTSATALTLSTKGAPVTGFTATAPGMRTHLQWDTLAPAPTKYLIIRKKGTSASTWTPTDGVGTYSAGDTIDTDTIVIYHGMPGAVPLSYDDDNVDTLPYTYTIFANYSGDLYSTSNSAPPITPNTLDASLLPVTYIANGSNYNIQLNWSAPSPAYSLQKYVVVREVGSPTCLIEWAPIKDIDSNAGDPTGFTNEEIIYSGTGNTTTDSMGGGGVPSGTNVCYKLFVQYDGESLSNLVYSPGISQTYVPPNLPPEIEAGSLTANQQAGTENVNISYRVRDTDSTDLGITFTMVSPGGVTCQMNLTDTLTGIDGTFYTHTAIWNAGLAGECPGFEVTNAVIQITANDSSGNSVSQSTALPFKLDTLAPRLPTPNPDNFDLTGFSSTNDSIFFSLGSEITTDANSLNCEIRYALGSSVDITGTLLTGGPIACNPGANYSLTGLSPGDTYTFNIWAYDNYGHKTPAAHSMTYSTAVPPPATFTITPQGMRIYTAWIAPVTGIPDYYLLVRGLTDPITTPADGSTYIVGDVLGSGIVVYNSTGTSYDDDNVDNTTYYYRIYAHYPSGKYSSALTGNATAVAEPPITFSGTSSLVPVVTYINTPPANLNSFENYLIWKKEQPSCTTDGNLIDGNIYNNLDVVDGGTIIYKSNTDPNSTTDSTLTQTGHTYCYKIFAQYNGETTNTIYSNTMFFQITPPNSPPTLSALSVTQSIGSDDIVINFTINDPDPGDAGNLSVSLSITNPPAGCNIGTITGALTGLSNGPHSVTWTDADTTCPDFELPNAGLQFIAHDLIDYSTAQVSNFLLDTKAPTLIDGLTLVSVTSDTIIVRLSTNPFFNNPLSVDQNLKGGGESFKIYYKQDITVSDSDTQLASFDTYTLGQTYTATPLSSSSQYAFNIWAYDKYGHSTEYTTPLKPLTPGLNAPPVVQFVTQPAQTTGTGNVTFQFEVKDQNSDPLNISLSLENNPSGCVISGVTGFTNPVSSLPTFNTISSTWNAKVTCDGADQTDLKIKITVSDSINPAVEVTSDPFLIDTKNPDAPDDLTLALGAAAANQVKVTLGANGGTDTHLVDGDWHIYRVQGGAGSFPTNPFSDPLATLIKTYDPPYTPSDVFTDTGLTPNTDYTYNICLHDDYMNYTCATAKTIHTESSTLSLNILGIASGLLIGTETTNITTTSTSIPFGSISVGDTRIGALGLEGSSNVTNGYTINIRQDQNLTSGANIIPALPASNASPITWPVSPATSYLGYSSLNLTRFSGGANWAGLNTSDFQVSTQTSPGTYTDNILFKLTTKAPQPAGIYSNIITFSILANP